MGVYNRCILYTSHDLLFLNGLLLNCSSSSFYLVIHPVLQNTIHSSSVCEQRALSRLKCNATLHSCSTTSFKTSCFHLIQSHELNHMISTLVLKGGRAAGAAGPAMEALFLFLLGCLLDSLIGLLIPM